MTESVYKKWVFAGKVYSFAVVDDRKWYRRVRIRVPLGFALQKF